MRPLLDYATVRDELLELDGNPALQLALLKLLSEGRIEASRRDDGQICFRLTEHSDEEWM
jgi:hypothetical protein